MPGATRFERCRLWRPVVAVAVAVAVALELAASASTSASASAAVATATAVLVVMLVTAAVSAGSVSSCDAPILVGFDFFLTSNLSSESRDGLRLAMPRVIGRGRPTLPPMLSGDSAEGLF